MGWDVMLCTRDVIRGAARVEKMVGPSCSELILRYTILGGSYVEFPNIGRVQTRATRAEAADVM